MNVTETALKFDCQGELLIGVLATAGQPAGNSGVIIVVGGPQYRAGSHRHFVILSRELAAAGIPCLRFDYRGMGDSTGKTRDFTNVHDDIRAAVDTMLNKVPNVRRVFLWGLCDGACAAAFYAAEDSRISGLVLLNPWVHTAQAEAKVYLKHYYLQRLVSASFWTKLAAGEVKPAKALDGLIDMIRRAWSRDASRHSRTAADSMTLPQQLYLSLQRRSLPALVILSGKDYVAKEFEDLVEADHMWSRLIARMEVNRLPEADHTFSDPEETSRVNQATIAWILSHPKSDPT